MASYEATLTADGQITLPEEIRASLGLKGGDRVVLRQEDGRTILSKNRDALAVMREIVRRARAESRPVAPSDDPIGDDLIEADERSKPAR